MKKITKALLKKRENRKLKRDYKQALKEFKEFCLLRDNYTCQVCRKSMKNDKSKCQVHHIIPKTYKEYSTDVNNGIVLCYRCHKADKNSAHQNSLFFSLWLEKNKEDIYYYLISKLEGISILN